MFIVQYKGGGYDGCFWEWNFAAINSAILAEATEFEDIFSSGYAGCKTLEKLQEFNQDEVYVYDMSNPEQVADFDKSANPQHVMGVAQWILQNHEDDYPSNLMRCDKCGCSLLEDVEMGNTDVLGSWHGIGGIASQPETKMCRDCAEADEFENFWKPEILRALEDAEFEFPEGATDKDIENLIWEAMRKSDNYLEPDYDGFTMDIDSLVDYMVENRAGLLRSCYNQDNQLDFLMPDMV